LSSRAGRAIAPGWIRPVRLLLSLLSLLFFLFFFSQHCSSPRRKHWIPFDLHRVSWLRGDVSRVHAATLFDDKQPAGEVECFCYNAVLFSSTKTLLFHLSWRERDTLATTLWSSFSRRGIPPRSHPPSCGPTSTVLFLPHIPGSIKLTFSYVFFSFLDIFVIVRKEVKDNQTRYRF